MRYKSFTALPRDLDKKLNKQAKFGWVLVSVTTYGHGVLAVMRKDDE